jgi:membrane-associated phospholipid phosphatase
LRRFEIGAWTSRRVLTLNLVVFGCLAARASALPGQPEAPAPDSPSAAIQLGGANFHLDLPPEGLPQDPQTANAQPNSSKSSTSGLIKRSLKRGLEDQKEIYSAPFRPSNIKWDALFLAGTGALLATDRRISRSLPDTHLNISRNSSNVAIVGMSIVSGAIWVYGRKGDHPHARETGDLELETLANTFIVYTGMQFLAGRERPDEGTGNGRFWKHNGFNSSFPGGHAMFSWAMATVLAHEYPKPWVEWLSYGAATTVTVGRFVGREHFASDVAVGSVLGYLIGTHIFHAHCRPGISEACHSPLKSALHFLRFPEPQAE